jgi:4-alpha-glucanotransferase
MELQTGYADNKNLLNDEIIAENKRGAGVLLSISSLPSPYGIGTMGEAAYRFIDRLAETGFSYWQVLPIGPTSLGDSPYQSFSVFAGNPYFIDLDTLIAEGLLEREDVEEISWYDSPDRVSYEKLWAMRYVVLRKAYKNAVAAGIVLSEDYKAFKKDNSFWLDDYSLYMACKNHFNNIEWLQWDEKIRFRDKASMNHYKTKLAEDIEFWNFLQFEFLLQWADLRLYAEHMHISIIGDIPIYAALDSSDVWANRELFQLDDMGCPTDVAGCPPDYFSPDGQKWGNPLYNWEKLEETGFDFWKKRIEVGAKLFDVIRIDHFIGMVRYYTIPANKLPKDGCYKKGPGMKLIKALDEARGKSKIIAEDLGDTTKEVDDTLLESGYAGMKLVEFAFDSGPDNKHLPHNITRNNVVYGGTHDNETLLGFCRNMSDKDYQFALEYTGAKDVESLMDALYRMAFNSVADTVIFQMQDLLALGNEARMNKPATLGNNWRWRLTENQYSQEIVDKFERFVYTSGRKTKKLKTLEEYIRNQGVSKSIAELSNEEIYKYILGLCQKKADERKRINGKLAGKKKLYYISAEFLIGKLLGNNLINLGMYDEIAGELSAAGKSLAEIEELENEPSLGNGGLGRLAACFLDSIATLGLAGDGIGLNYHLGLFKQNFKNYLQDENVNPWIDKRSFLVKKENRYKVEFGDCTVESTLYDISVTGYNNVTNELHLFDLDSVDDSIVKSGISFDKTDIKKNLTLFLYPDDSDEEGNLLRIYQQYFMVSNAAQFILEETKKRGCKLTDLEDYVAIQINDTHPSMIIPELIRLLMKEGIDRNEAIDIVSKVCAYTNHTILSEALEKWPISYIEKVAPQIVPIIKYLDSKIRAKYDDKSVYIIDDEDRVHMANMDIHFGCSVNGVAYLHTEILKNSELNNFYKLYPEKFNNKTNGITFRRWLIHANHELAAYIEEKIGKEYRRDASRLEELLRYENDMTVLDKLLTIKRSNKQKLADYILDKEGISINPDSIYDIQVKRLHEYKRQQLNILYGIHKYIEIKKGNRPNTPITMIFGAKAAPAYTIAKDIIHLILCMQELTLNDPEVSPYLRIVMLENYNVTYAEKVIPASDISEQISLASKEASGTGNMKFMLNGAVTLGTMDGANVEIRDLVGDDNIYIFGEDSDTVIERYKRGDYSPKEYYENDEILKEAVDFIISDEITKIGSKENLERLYNELLNKDWFMTFPDFEDYLRVKERAFRDYDNRYMFAKKMLINIAKSGFFSSDRTINEYNRDIWKL